MKTSIDLHMHSLYSDDGQFTEEELVNIAHKSNLKVMAIADHNSVEAVEKAKIIAEDNDIKLTNL